MTAEHVHKAQQKNLRAHKKRQNTLFLVLNDLSPPFSSKDFRFLGEKTTKILSRGLLQKWVQQGQLNLQQVSTLISIQNDLQNIRKKSTKVYMIITSHSSKELGTLMVGLGPRVCSSFFLLPPFLLPFILSSYDDCNVQPASRPIEATLMLYISLFYRKFVDLFS